MEPENIDWETIESILEEDDTYENFNAPKWVDFSVPDDLTDDQAWFCSSGCKHSKTAQDFLKSTRNSKMKLLRSLSISEILNRRHRDQVKPKATQSNSTSPAKVPHPESKKTEGSNAKNNLHMDSENKNPNLSTPIPNYGTKPKKGTMNHPNKEKKQETIQSYEKPSKSDRNPQLKSTFSARNLLGGREILSQITEFCSELKRLATKSSRIGGKEEKESGGVLGELKERVKRRERMPLLVVKEREV